MSNQPQRRWGTVAMTLLVVAGGVGLWTWSRFHGAADFGKPWNVQTPAGTNYVVRLIDVTVGKSDSGWIVMVGARLENPNKFPLALPRKSFILVDHDKNYYLPTSTSAASDAIQLPAEGNAERETMSYTVPGNALGGFLAVQVGQYHWAQLKSDRPFTRPLQSGEFVSFRQRDW